MIRKAREADIVQIMNLTHACARHLVKQKIFQWNDLYPNKEIFEKDISHDQLYVYELNDSVIGCIVITELMDPEYENVKWLTSEGNSYYVHRLAVQPDHQGKGYARSLMDFAETKAKSDEKASIRLDTFSKNLRNQRFYEQRGYRRLEPVYFLNQSRDPFYCYELLL